MNNDIPSQNKQSWDSGSIYEHILEAKLMLEKQFETEFAIVFAARKV